MRRKLIITIVISAFLVLIIQGYSALKEKAETKQDVVKERVIPPITAKIVKTKIAQQQVDDKNIKSQNKANTSKYEVQLLASMDLPRTLLTEIKINKLGFSTKVVKKNINGNLFYRLRLAKQYTLSDAKKKGEYIQAKSNSIDSYWVHKIN